MCDSSGNFKNSQNEMSKGNPAPKPMGKWTKYILAITINGMLWFFIGLGFFLVLLVANLFGFIELLPRAVPSVAKFFDVKFLVALVAGSIFMAVVLRFISDVIVKLRKTIPWWRKINGDLIPDDKFREYVQVEIFGQINNVANLSMMSGLFLLFDKSGFGNKILESSLVNPSHLITTGAVLYVMSAAFYWLYADD